MKVSKEDLKELFEQRSEEYLSAFNVTLQRLKEKTYNLFDEKNDPMILEKYLEFIFGLNSDISKMIEKEELIN
ncbi:MULTISPECIES: hypothetical protein [Fusobacterium]|jgi:hypothetical protein|uniref:Uncharacterized protein n=1 Tax=Fusobacterium animalis 7_1 TaxID=457405 RepID=A0A140STP0_9FUSO|nr:MULTISPECIES: hypothetical protein [Fusobacterium]AHH93372.1 hypothetical protein FSDG_03002 [Fusobacterium animalis 7_1]EPC07666.1 hypothetical protein HMPREF9369_03249 [Fusobacterium polymorphum F0401]ERT39896.1 hypothetical protein HMPREF1538_02225 [Fusobacterium nucleatum CTI-1]